MTDGAVTEVGRPGEPPALPSVGRLVQFELRGRTEPVPSRVEDDADGILVLAAPHRPGEPAIVRLDEKVVVTWETRKGQARMPAVVEGLHEGDPPTCTVRQAGDIEVVQRRRYVRAESPRGITLGFDNDRSVPATLIELSEGGMSCDVFAGVRVPDGSWITTTLPLDDGPVDVAARMVRVVPVQQDRRRLSFLFVDLDDTGASRIRRHVFAVQVRNRPLEAQ